MTTPKAVSTDRTVITLFFLALTASLLLFSGATASAAPPIAKDGKIHACYKAKGKGKGALRLVGGAKTRCPRQWKKVAWQATPIPGRQGNAGPPGLPGPTGANGLPGLNANVVIEGLESKIAQLLTRVANLEGVLKGVTNQELLGAIGLSPLVEELCTQAGTLTTRINLLEGVLGGLSLNGVLTTLGGLLNIPVLPGALPAFSCSSTP